MQDLVKMSVSEDMEKLRVGEEARGEEAAISKSKLVRKDIKLPKDFEKKLAFVLYDVFSEEIRSLWLNQLQTYVSV